MKKTKISFEHFLEKFPEIELPVILGEDTHIEFSKANDPLSSLAIEQYIIPLEKEIDEYTEFIACFRLADTYEFKAIVYWKASLMNYEYSLTTFTQKGLFIDRKVIAGTFSTGELLIKSVATIDSDWIIHIASGPIATADAIYDPSSSTVTKFELLPDGRIVESNEL